MMVVYLYYAMWSPLRLNINHSEGVFWTLKNHALLGYINDSVYVPTCFRHIIAWRRKNVTNATQNKIQREELFEMWYLLTVSSTLNLFWEAHWLYISWFLDLGRTQPPSPPTSNSVDVTKKKWLKEEQRIMRRNALQESMKREAIFGSSS